MSANGGASMPNARQAAIRASEIGWGELANPNVPGEDGRMSEIGWGELADPNMPSDWLHGSIRRYIREGGFPMDWSAPPELEYA